MYQTGTPKVIGGQPRKTWRGRTEEEISETAKTWREVKAFVNQRIR
jgi:hypothetical protein